MYVSWVWWDGFAPRRRGLEVLELGDSLKAAIVSSIESN